MYRLRPATVEDIDAVVHHRVGMFTDMGTPIDADAVGAAFRRWLVDALPSQLYRGWVVEIAAGDIVSGGGLTILPWPPGPVDLTGRIAVVYNMYTEPAHRRRGLALRVMQAMHAWCREAGITSVGLAASPSGRPLYESMGYRLPSDPYLFASLE